MVTALIRSRWARARWLVLAPHPDDETLGAGALIADAAGRGLLAGVVYLTDGAGSHPGAGGRLARRRRREGRLAIRRLAGPDAPEPAFLDWPDAHPPGAGSPGFLAGARRLARLLRDGRVDALAVTAPGEPHCDHAAAARLAAAAIGLARRKVALFDYLVWAPATLRSRCVLATAAMPSGRRRHALQAHASQVGPVFGPGFRLDPARLRMPPRDLLYRRDAA